MSQSLEWVGTCRGKIKEFGIRESDSGRWRSASRRDIDSYYDTDTCAWVECEDQEYEAQGDLWIIKKDGTPNAGQVESMCQFAGWNGDLEGIANGTWQPKACSFVLNREEYKEQVRHRISFLNAYDRTPGNVGNVSPDKVKALQDRYGAQLRALAGNVQQKALPAPAKASGPKKPGSKPAPATKQPDNTITGVSAGPGVPLGDDIPW